MSQFMRAMILLLFALGLSSALSAAPPEPNIPLAGRAVSYEWRLRFEPETRKLSKERGDVLLKLLDGGRTLRKPKPPPRGVLADPVPSRTLIIVTLDNGTKYEIGITWTGDVVWLEDIGQYIINWITARKIKQWLADLDTDVLHEIMSTPRPWSYKIGTLLADGGTLSGVARLFYNDGSKWPVIYEANKTVIKNPHTLSGSEVLTIP